LCAKGTRLASGIEGADSGPHRNYAVAVCTAELEHVAFGQIKFL
jgi:hypothetical protein